MIFKDGYIKVLAVFLLSVQDFLEGGLYPEGFQINTQYHQLKESCQCCYVLPEGLIFVNKKVFFWDQLEDKL